MAALGKAPLVVCLLVCLHGTYSEQLKPFVAWSSSDVLSSIKPSDTASEMVNAMATFKDNLFVIFLADKLSFDDIAKHGDVYGEKKDGDFANLKSVLSSSKSQLWSGVSDSTADISSTIASLLITDLTTVDGSDVVSGSVDMSGWHGVVTVVMKNGLSIQNQDLVLGAVVKALGSRPYIALYSQAELSTQTSSQRSRRDAPEPRLGRRAAANEDGGSANSRVACTVGGVFHDNATSNSSGNACMMFCIKSSLERDYINMTIKLRNSSTSSCKLRHPSNVSYCCQQDLNVAPECLGEKYPFVMLRYEGLTSENHTAINLTNECDPSFFSNVSADTDKNVSGASVLLKFVFPNNFGQTNNTNAYNNAWNMRIIPTLIYEGTDIPTTTLNISYARIPPNMKLYEDFKVPTGLSYACAAGDFQRYGPETVNSTSNKTVDPLKSRLAAGNTTVVGDIQLLTLPFIQVQAYGIRVSTSSFSEAYNCVGYFTYASLMGIFTVVVLLIILYSSLACIFSMNSIDRFEDPRGQTITVEKLH